jgi:hypothetical protein
MRTATFALSFLLLLASCKEVTFKTPQPQGKKPLEKIPRSLHGRYLALTEEGKSSNDTIIISSNGYRFGYFDRNERAITNDNFDRGSLSDSLVLKSYKGYYFLNVNQDPEWILRVIKPEKNGDLMFMILEDKDADFNDFLQKLSLEVAIDSMTTDRETLYQISPTPGQLLGLIKKGYFSSTRLVKIR